jgi:FG-GAP-like repeat/Bacterial Ig-like domain/Secretion system C-terminal sorting domain
MSHVLHPPSAEGRIGRPLTLYLLLSALLVPGLALAQPTITGLSPVRNARSAVVSTNIGITFDQPMNTSAASAGSVKVFAQQSRGLMSGTQGGAASVSGNTITFNPTTNFKPGETVFVTTTTAAQSSGGSNLAAGKVHQFTTAVGGTGEGNFQRPPGNGVFGVNPAGHPDCIATGDVDGDGDLDFVTADAGAFTASVQLNDGTGVFTPHPTNPFPGVFANPRFVTLGDIDGDGDLDFVTPSPTVGGVNVRLNDGTGYFTASAAAPDLTGFNLPTVTRLADMDADGDLDLLINGRFTLHVRYNNGSGNFSSGADFGLGSTATGGLAVGDLDNDGDLDVAVTATGAIQVFHNTGAGAFAFVQSVGQPDAAVDAVFADFDGDGDLDMATGLQSPALVTICLNAGNGTFTLSAAIPVYSSTQQHLETGDVDADGDIDLIAPSYASYFVEVLINGGTGNFASYAPNPQPSLNLQSGSVALADVDADGDLDLLSGNPGSPGAVNLRLNQVAPIALTTVAPTRHQRNAPAAAPVTISFSEPLSNTAATMGAVRVFSHQRGGRMSGAQGGTATVSSNALTFDPTNDFRPGETVSVTTTTDVQSTNGTFIVRSHVHQFTVAAVGGPGGFSWGQQLTVSTNNAPALASGDVDGDGDADLVTITLPSGPGAGVAVYLNGGAGLLTPHPTTPTSLVSLNGVRDLELADMDGDGDLDVLVGQRNAVLVMMNDGTGVFTQTQNRAIFSTPNRLAVGDFDGDGDLDVVGALENGSMNVMLNQGTGTLGFPGNYLSGGRSYGVAVGDVDLDGDLDIVTTNQNTGNSTTIWFNNGLGNFETTATTFGPRTGAALADSDGDGDLDLLTTTGPAAGVVNVQLNNGDGTFGAVSQSVPVGNTPESVVTADFNGDGAPDLLVSNVLDNSLSVRLNDGTGTFAATGEEIAVGSQTRKPVAVDLDNDGDLDVLAAGLFNNRVITRFNGPLDLLVDNTQPVPEGIYRNINVTNGGDGTLTGDVIVTGTLQINLGSRLNDGCFRLTGGGNFVLRAGGTLSICDPAGISASGNTGAVQVAGTRTFSADAIYIYNGSVAQVTGAGLPATVRELAIQNPAGVSLSQAVGIGTALRLSAGTLSTDGQALTLLSTAARTAYAVHAGGTTSGPVTVQRFVGSPTALGYRHLSAPVSTTVGDLSTIGFTAFVNGAYNAIPTPTLPNGQFPNVFGFDETRGGAVPDFALGYYSPTRLTDPLTPGRGWSVLMSGNRTPDFVGPLTTGNVSLPTLTRTGNFSGAGEKSGWHLLGNPYPQPIDWDLATASIPAGMSTSISVYRTSGGNNGIYLTRTNGIGSLPDGVVPLGQAFFAQVTGAGPVSFTFTNALRVEANPATVARPAVETRPLVRLTLTKAGAPAETDATFVYVEAGASLGADDRFDGFKPARNVGLPTLATLINGIEAAVNGLPECTLTQPTTIELTAVLPTPGTYHMAVGELLNFGSTPVALLDRLTGTRSDLTTQPVVALTATRAQQEIIGRFALEFNGGRVLGTAPLVSTASIALFPNPATGAVRVTTTPHTSADLLDATGRLIRQVTTDETGATTIGLTDVPAGLYVVRVGSHTKRLVVK